MVDVVIDTEYFTLHSLCEGVYAAIAKPGQGAWSNAGIVDLGDELLVFDALGTPSAGKELRCQAENITGKKVKYLINSHYHGDHVFGNQVFMDTTIIATSLTHKWCEEKNKIDDVEKEERGMEHYLLKLNNQIDVTDDAILKKSLINQFNEMSKVLRDLHNMNILLPSVLFEEKLIIKGASRSVELYCLGGGHSPSDTFMYLPTEKIAFMGDLITEDLHVPIYDSTEFLSILQVVKQMDIEMMVPGHGGIGRMAMCDTILDYLSLLFQRATEAHHSKITREDFIADFELPIQYQQWQGVNGIKANLSKVYTDLQPTR